VSLRGFQKLKSLNCAWYMVRPILEDSDEEEPLDSGFYREEDYKGLDTDFDIRNILPESLEELYLHGSFFDTDGQYEWWAMERVFRVPNTMTPRLTLEKTCIRQIWNDETRERIGTADEPVNTYTDLLMIHFFHGHGFAAI
jgi:hypothetical protein